MTTSDWAIAVLALCIATSALAAILLDDPAHHWAALGWTLLVVGAVSFGFAVGMLLGAA